VLKVLRRVRNRQAAPFGEALDAALSLRNHFEQLQAMFVTHRFGNSGELRIEGALRV
jgi:hypothetical protein